MTEKKRIGRPRKATATTETAAAAAPMVHEHHTVVKKYTTVAEMESPEPPELEIEDYPYFGGPAPDDDIEASLDEIGLGETAWELYVFGLRDYERYQNAGQRFRVFCGKLPIESATYIPNQEFLEDIQIRWTSNFRWFYLQIKHGPHFHPLKLAPVCVEPLDPVSRAKHQAAVTPTPPGAAPIAYYPGQAPPDTLGDFLRQAEQFKKLTAIFTPPAVANPAPAPAPAAPVVNTLESAMLTLANANGDLVEAATEKIGKIFRGRGGVDRETTLMDIGLALAQNFDLERILEKGRQLVEAARGQATAPASLPAAPGANTAQQNGPDIPPGAAPEQVLANFVLNAVDNPTAWPPSTAAIWIVEFERRYPAVKPSLDWICAMEPAAAIQMFKQSAPHAAPLLDKAHVLDWFKALFIELNGEPEPGDPAAPGSTPPANVDFIVGGE